MISTIAATMLLAMAQASAAPAPLPPPDEMAPTVDLTTPATQIPQVPPLRPSTSPARTAPLIVAPPIRMPPPAPPGRPFMTHARERANPASLIDAGDYPGSALRAGEQGTVHFTLDIGPNGRVTACTIEASSGSSALDSVTCRIMQSRARFTPARDPEGVAIADKYRGQVAWRINRPLYQPFEPLMFVEEIRSDAAGIVTCWSTSDGEPPREGPCTARTTGPALAALARAQGKPLALATIVRLTPDGAPELPDRAARGDLYKASDAILTIAADGSILECRLGRNQWLGGGNRGVPPDPCLDWYPGMKLYAPAAEGTPPRKIKLALRGYAAH
jgi:protein TonB